MKVIGASFGQIQLEDLTVINHSLEVEFASFSRACGEYTVDSYTDEDITITHINPALSGTYDLGNDPSIKSLAIPHLTVIKDLNGWTNAQTKEFGKALWALIKLAQE